MWGIRGSCAGNGHVWNPCISRKSTSSSNALSKRRVALRIDRRYAAQVSFQVAQKNDPVPVAVWRFHRTWSSSTRDTDFVWIGPTPVKKEGLVLVPPFIGLWGLCRQHLCGQQRTKNQNVQQQNQRCGQHLCGQTTGHSIQCQSCPCNIAPIGGQQACKCAIDSTSVPVASIGSDAIMTATKYQRARCLAGRQTQQAFWDSLNQNFHHWPVYSQSFVSWVMLCSVAGIPARCRFFTNTSSNFESLEFTWKKCSWIACSDSKNAHPWEKIGALRRHICGAKTSAVTTCGCFDGNGVKLGVALVVANSFQFLYLCAAFFSLKQYILDRQRHVSSDHKEIDKQESLTNNRQTEVQMRSIWKFHSFLQLVRGPFEVLDWRACRWHHGWWHLGGSCHTTPSHLWWGFAKVTKGSVSYLSSPCFSTSLGGIGGPAHGIHGILAVMYWISIIRENGHGFNSHGWRGHGPPH